MGSSMVLLPAAGRLGVDDHYHSFKSGKSLLLKAEKGGRQKIFPARRHWRSPTNTHHRTGGRRKQSHFSSKVVIDVALYESSTASFDEYMENKPRFCQAMFANHGTNQQLNEEEWRIYMEPIQFLFLSSQPVIDMRVRRKSGGVGYPREVPRNTTMVIVFDSTASKLLWSEGTTDPDDFTVSVHGTLYPDRSRSPYNRLKGQFTMGVSFVLPPVLALVPEPVYRAVTESVLKGLGETMKKQVNKGLLNDYNKFKREKLSSTSS